MTRRERDVDRILEALFQASDTFTRDQSAEALYALGISSSEVTASNQRRRLADSVTQVQNMHTQR